MTVAEKVDEETFRTGTLRFVRYGDGWNVEAGKEWKYVDVIVIEGAKRVKLPSTIIGDETGEAEFETKAVCTVKTVEDSAYPSKVKTILTCRPSQFFSPFTCTGTNNMRIVAIAFYYSLHIFPT